MIRVLGVFLSIVLTTGCASFHRVSIPHWDRYEQGELAGFLRAPGEKYISRVWGLSVQRARGRIVLRENERSSAGWPQHPIIAVELRGPDASREVRTVATRSGQFDFGPLPEGTYVLKATTILREDPDDHLRPLSAFGVVTVSNSAKPTARIAIPLG